MWAGFLSLWSISEGFKTLGDLARYLLRIFTGMGLGLLIGVTLSITGIYRGMVDYAKVLLDNSSADLWVVQKDTLLRQTIQHIR